MIQKDKLIKEIITHLSAVILFLGISLIYFSPQVFGDKILPQGDTQQYEAMSHELQEYYRNEGKTSTWTNSMFSGMPAYQIGVYGGSPNFLNFVEAPLKALGNNIGPVFAGMLMAYILFLCMGFNPIVAIVGAVAYSLSSYNIIIIDAGHITKAWAIAYLPLIMASMAMLFRRKYLTASLLMALGLALQIKSNHLQITYYVGILCLFLFVAFAIEMVREKKIKDLSKATAMLIIAAVVAVLCNFGGLYSNYEMGHTSMRGKSELTTEDTGKKDTGLDKEYAFRWSYGKAETLSLLIPNIYGGSSSGKLDRSTHFYKALAENGMAKEMYTDKAGSAVRANTYWGDQPFTSGPVYIGAIICFLFLLGMIIIRHPAKWAILAGTIFLLLMSWGRNFDWFNNFLFNHLPMYNKFRTVSMALVIPALTMVMIGVWALKEFFSGEIEKAKLQKALYLSAGIVGGIALFFWIAPGFFFNFITEAENQYPEWYLNSLPLDREAMLSSDARRSLIFILLGGGLLWFTLNSKANRSQMTSYATIGIALLVLIDLWGVDKRYLNEDHFVDATEFKKTTFTKTVADEYILHDPSVSHRVYKIGNPFNDAYTSYYHKSIGGYHAAKLGRYQGLIDYYLQPETDYIKNVANAQLKKGIELLNAQSQSGEQPDTQAMIEQMQETLTPYLGQVRTLAMLNTKYIIYHPELPPLVNPYAMGNAWFVSNYEVTDNADAEIKKLADLDIYASIVIDSEFEEELAGLNLAADSTATITLLESKPDYLKYKAKTNSEQIAVFSEIYYQPGWRAYIDGDKADHIRANWTLRAMPIPAGEHTIEFLFEPAGYSRARGIATASSGLLVLLLIGAIIYPLTRKEKE